MPVFYLVIDNKNPGFDACFESSEFSRAMNDIKVVTEKLRIKNAYKLFSYAPQNSLCPPGYEETEIPWFEPQEGIEWLDAVVGFMRATPTLAETYPVLLSELDNCKRVLHDAKRIGAKWHFEMDI